MAKVFVSHATADRDFVRKEILGLLRAIGLSPWYSEDDITTASHWERAILHGLEKSDWFVIVLSSRSAQSEWVKDELNWAIDHRPGRIVPILIEECDLNAFHLRLSRIQHIDFRRDERAGREGLIKVLVDAEYEPHFRKATTDSPLVRRARAFWSAFSDAPCQIVMGRHRAFEHFEYSGLLGVGCAIAMTELKSHLDAIGLRNVQIAFADRMSGDALNTHLVVLGGPDGNSVAREVVRRLDTSIRFGNADRHEIAFHDSQTGATYVPRGTGTSSIEDDYGLIVLGANPFAPDRRLLLIAGSFGYGTWAASRFLMSEPFLSQSTAIAREPLECLVHAELFRETPQQATMIAMRGLAR